MGAYGNTAEAAASSCTNVKTNQSAKYDKVSAYPNPCNDRCIFRALHPDMTITIYNIMGKRVKELKNISSNGIKIWKLDNEHGLTVANGIYIYAVTNMAGKKQIGKIIVVK